MAQLSDEEKSTLKKLQEKLKAPDEAPIGKSIHVNIDLGDENQVKAAHKLGLLSGLFSDDDEDGGEDGNGEDDETPKRRGYFKDVE